jgi:antitoxin component YwqK of YwqJK toxin-antitoxin module
MKVVLILLGLLGSAWWVLSSGSHEGAWAGAEAQVTYYGNGQPRSKQAYRDGQPHGPAEEWFPDGSLAARGRYEDGRREGAWTFWLEGGAVDPERSGLYEDGRRVGPAPDRLAQDRADS